MNYSDLTLAQRVKFYYICTQKKRVNSFINAMFAQFLNRSGARTLQVYKSFSLNFPMPGVFSSA